MKQKTKKADLVSHKSIIWTSVIDSDADKSSLEYVIIFNAWQINSNL